ncbi:protein phosphatase 2C domain-containing protein [Erythrobacter gaetbuli]|uniref:Protein phosphatase 2C domain-containing protein n=1 Tax=Qipengyuania gaetbuli TaxID=266952 RepID=A0A844Y1U1_9SPHN|nr:PP2C family serine/threonine-protein phosphatase [Qipengyuania gaetbuli]MXO52370.1 protein phosphatase 2C domain-containing protein [Qipengyuania gaetbuli]
MPDKDRRWRWAVGSEIGSSHLKHGTRKQDAYVAKALPHGALLFAVADGAGSASLGGQGASLACRHLATCTGEWFAKRNDLPSADQVMGWLDDLRDLFTSLADRREELRREFASTLVALLHTPDAALAIQVGDSALVGRTEEGCWEAICWPENGQYASSTYFLTDDPEVRLRTAVLENSYDAFALLSDGLEDIALEQDTLRPFAGFFDPMLRPVDNAAGSGKLSALSLALSSYLQSEAVCQRTDDDKTLILVSGKQ